MSLRAGFSVPPSRRGPLRARGRSARRRTRRARRDGYDGRAGRTRCPRCSRLGRHGAGGPDRPLVVRGAGRWVLAGRVGSRARRPLRFCGLPDDRPRSRWDGLRLHPRGAPAAGLLPRVVRPGSSPGEPRDPDRRALALRPRPLAGPRSRTSPRSACRRARGATTPGCSFCPAEPTGYRVAFVTSDGASSQLLYADDQLRLDTWTHVAFTYDEGTKTIYVDALAAAPLPGVPIATSNQDLLIGTDENDGAAVDWPYAGLLDEIVIYDRVLSPAEINALAHPD